MTTAGRLHTRLVAETLLVVGLASAASYVLMLWLGPRHDGWQLVVMQGVALALIVAPALHWRDRQAVSPSAVPPQSEPTSKVAFSPNKYRARGFGVTVAALLVGLLVTCAATTEGKLRIDADARLRFDRDVERIEAEVMRRFQQPIDGLKGARGLYTANRSVNRDQFRGYVESRDLASEFPGVRGFGFVERVMRDDLNAFASYLRAEMARDFQVRTSGNAADLYVVKYIEPFSLNFPAWGYDMGSESVRREALERAVTSAEPSLTGPLILGQGKRKEPGFIFLVPIYRQGSDPRTAPQRFKALVGLVYAPMFASDLLDGAANVADRPLALVLFNGDGTDTEQVVFDSDGHLRNVKGLVTEAQYGDRLFSTVRTLAIGGRLLTLRASTSPAFEASIDYKPVAYVGGGGAVLSLCLALMVWVLTSARVRAQTLAERMTVDLDRLAQVVRHTSNAVFITDRELRIQWINEGFTRISGYDIEVARGKTPGELLGCGKADPEVLQRLQDAAIEGKPCRVEILNRRRDGTEYWVDTEIQPLRNSAGEVTGFMEIASDITDKREAHLALQAALNRNSALLQEANRNAQDLARERKRLDDILNGTNAGTWEWNAQTGVTLVNTRWASMLGYELAELAPITFATWESLVHPDDLGPAQAALQAHVQGSGDQYDSELRMRHRAGHWVWVQTRGRISTRTADGRAEWVAGTHMDITAAKQAAAELQRNVAMLQTIMDNLPCGLSVFDGNLDLLACNAEFKTLLNLPDTLFDVPVTRFDSIIRHNAARGEYGPGEIEPLVNGISERARHPVAHHFERTRPDGTVLEVRGGPLPGGGFVTTYTNITVRKRAEAAVADSEHMMRLVMDSIPGRLTYFDRHRRLTFANKASYDFYGGSPETSFGTSFVDFVGPAAMDQLDRVDAALRGQAQTYDFERELPHGGKAYSVVHMIPDQRDGTVAGFIGMAIDVTAVKRAEQEVRRAEALLRGAIDAVNEGFVLFDADDRLVFCNDKYREMYRTVDDLMVPGASFEQLIRAAAERGQHEEAIGHIDDWVAQRLARHRAGSGTMEQQTANGRWLRVVERKMPDGHNVGFRIDITDLKNATAAAEAASRSKSQFLANMSHEIRTPMNAILGMLKLLQRTELTARQQDYANKTERAARALLGLLNDILDFSKVEAGKMSLDLRPFKLSDVLQDLSVILSANLGAKALELLFEVDDDVPAVLIGDDMRLQQVLVNLGGNAIKFTESGEIVVRVVVAEIAQDHVELGFSVRDSGIGIAPEHQAHIFDGFSQAESSTTRRFGGTGLGLAICQRLVGLMGGSIELDSAPGKGSTFRFTIGLQIGRETTQTQITTRSTATNTPGLADQTGVMGASFGTRAQGGSVTLRLSGLNLLVVDDNANNRQIAQELLEAEGATVILANDGQQGIAAVAETNTLFDAVLMDVQMPNMDGYTATAHIRQSLGLDRLPIIAMTANAMPSDHAASLAAGMNDHVGKPFDLDALVATLLQHVRRQVVPLLKPTSISTDAAIPHEVLAVAASRGVELANAVRRLGGRPAVWLKTVRSFVKELPERADEFDRLMDQGKYVDAGRLMHTLRGVGATLGAWQLAQVTASAEDDLAGWPSGHDGAGSPALDTSRIRSIIATTASDLDDLAAMLTTHEDDNYSEVTKPRDTRVLMEQVEPLMALLQQSDMAATDVFSDLLAEYETPWEDELRPLSDAMAALDFEAALEACEHLLQELQHEARRSPHE